MKTLRALVLISAVSLAGAVLPAQAALPGSVDGKELPSLAPMLERVQPAVVNISTTGRVQVQENPLLQDPFFRHFFDAPSRPRERRTNSLGSGVIVDGGKGYIITNHHVIHRADEITVTLMDGRELLATLVGSDPETDVAVIQVEAQDLTALKLADSDALRVGDFVVAIGNPFGLGQTVTSGIVSALGRTGLIMEGYEDFIQTDASINPGNSGGALVNLRGELVGINTAILSPAGGNVGIGFAIPTRMAANVMQQLIEHGEVRRGLLGVSVQDLTPSLAEAFGIKEATRGVIIAEVVPGSAAEAAGLQAGDVVLALDGEPVARAAAIRNRVGMLRVGEKVQIRILRDGKEQTITATIQEREAAAAQTGLTPRLKGAQFSESTDPTAPAGQRTRVVVSAVERGSPAAQAGLREGDVVLSVNRRPVTSLSEFQSAVRGSPDQVLLHIRRGGGALFLLIR
jgi:Do/DeqQ family serine protease